MEQEWEVQVRHIYYEANVCADALAKRGITNNIFCLFIVPVPILYTNVLKGIWLALGIIDCVLDGRILLVLYELYII